MARKNILSSNPPYAVESAIRRLGQDLRTARLRRNLTLDEVAQKIGTGRRAVIGAEKGQPSTSAVVYVALLWAYDLLGPWSALADPAEDVEGLAFSERRQRARSQASKDLDNDF